MRVLPALLQPQGKRRTPRIVLLPEPCPQKLQDVRVRMQGCSSYKALPVGQR